MSPEDGRQIGIELATNTPAMHPMSDYRFEAQRFSPVPYESARA
jgi:hypothetical protein